jgi:hypothetical protein
MMRATVVLLAIGALAGAPATAGAAGCVKKKGKVFSRDACRKAERPLDTSTLAPVGPTGPDGTRGDAGKFPLAIVDATDREIGPVLDFDLATALVLVTNAALASPSVFAVNPAGFGNIGDDAYSGVYYAEAECAGQAYLPEGLGKYVHVEGTAAYPTAGDATSITVASVETADVVLSGVDDLTERGGCCQAQAFTADVVPASSFPLSALGFTPPFRTVPR